MRYTRVDQGSQSRLGQLKYGGVLGVLLLCILLFLVSRQLQGVASTRNRASLRLKAQGQVHERDKILVSYSYYEKDEGQKENFEYFIMEGMGVRTEHIALPEGTDFSIVVNGDDCSPCAALEAHVIALQTSIRGLSAVWGSRRMTVLQRAENSGMDIAAHNVTLSYFQEINKLATYRFFLFLNSSVRGPFFPRWLQSSVPTWQWPDPFVSRLVGDVKLVASSIACLPDIDAGGYGPKVESWAFALDFEGLNLLLERGIFWMRTCKLCVGDEGIVVGSEYGLSKVILDSGFNLATLMARYAQGTDWRDPANWGCNNNVHPSRHGTYDGISMHPYETIFVKASWKVGEPFLSRYTRWSKDHHLGRSGTEGSFDKRLYDYAVSEAGRNPQHTEDLFLPFNHTCSGNHQ